MTFTPSTRRRSLGIWSAERATIPRQRQVSADANGQAIGQERLEGLTGLGIVGCCTQCLDRGGAIPQFSEDSPAGLPKAPGVAGLFAPMWFPCWGSGCQPSAAVLQGAASTGRCGGSAHEGPDLHERQGDNASLVSPLRKNAFEESPVSGAGVCAFPAVADPDQDASHVGVDYGDGYAVGETRHCGCGVRADPGEGAQHFR